MQLFEFVMCRLVLVSINFDTFAKLNLSGPLRVFQILKKDPFVLVVALNKYDLPGKLVFN